MYKPQSLVGIPAIEKLFKKHPIRWEEMQKLHLPRTGQAIGGTRHLIHGQRWPSRRLRMISPAQQVMR